MTASVGLNLIDEIERVSGLRETYKILRGMRGVNVEPAILLMISAIERAKDAIASDDAAEAMTALAGLDGFTQ